MRPEKIRKIRQAPKPEPVQEPAQPQESAPTQWLHLVPKDKAVTVWPHIAQYLNRANEYGLGRFEEHEILAHILAGMWDLFITTSYDAAMVGRIEAYPQARVYVVILFGGEGDHDWHVIQQVVDERAKAAGCSAIDILGRPGWRNILKDVGYRCTHHIYTRELEP